MKWYIRNNDWAIFGKWVGWGLVRYRSLGAAMEPNNKPVRIYQFPGRGKSWETGKSPIRGKNQTRDKVTQ